MATSNKAASVTREIFDRIVRVETILWNRCDDEVRKQTDQPLARIEVLRIIAHVEQCRVGDIAARLHITVGAVSKLVDRLEASGHCRRQPNPDDRRSSVLRVTDLGQTALTQAEAVMEPILQRYLATADLDVLGNALMRVEQALNEDAPKE